MPRPICFYFLKGGRSYFIFKKKILDDTSFYLCHLFTRNTLINLFIAIKNQKISFENQNQPKAKIIPTIRSTASSKEKE